MPRQPMIDGAVAPPSQGRSTSGGGSSTPSAPSGGGGGQASPVNVSNIGAGGLTRDQLAAVADALAMHESGMRNVPNSGGHSSASGYWQYTDGTWNNYGGYARAMDAPYEVQRERVMRDLARNIERYGSVEQGIAHHFYPRLAGDPSRWHLIPGEEAGSPHPGNPTVSQFVSSVMSNLGETVDVPSGGGGEPSESTWRRAISGGEEPHPAHVPTGSRQPSAWTRVFNDALRRRATSPTFQHPVWRGGSPTTVPMPGSDQAWHHPNQIGRQPGLAPSQSNPALLPVRHPQQAPQVPSYRDRPFGQNRDTSGGDEGWREAFTGQLQQTAGRAGMRRDRDTDRGQPGQPQRPQRRFRDRDHPYTRR